MSALTAAVESLAKATGIDLAEINFVRIDTRRGTVQVVGKRGVHRFELDPPKPAKKTTAKKAAPAKKAAKRPAKKTAAKKKS